jgi:RNA polymerase sigma-70 factor (ECF subfamily)
MKPLPARAPIVGAMVLGYGNIPPSPESRMDAAVAPPALATLLAESAAGSQAAFERLYRETASRLLAFILRFLRRRDAAEDCLQEAYIQIWRHARSYVAERGAPMSWMLSIARNAAIDRLRRDRRAPLVEETRDDEAAVEPAGDLAAEMLALAEAGEIGRAVADLPEAQRRAIHLAFYLGYTHEELAEKLGLPLGTVKSHVRRGLEWLKESLAP